MPPQHGRPPQQHGGYREPVSSAPTLYLIYNGHRYPVVKDQFIIGRGSKTSDLAIKDGNISRKHAAVIRRNGTYYIKDLGSTNGIDYKGMRIDNKRVDEGDIFHICDYELRFTYRPD
jgi:pSer/pThr/pTyr-binding forkhead associated (FHA) protein